MALRLVQTVFRLFLLISIFFGTLFSKEVPITKTVTINIPVKEYSVVEFPFKIKEIQAKSFTYRTKVKKKIKKSAIKKEGISLSKKKISLNKKKINHKNILGIEQGVNVLTFKPKVIGFTEIIVWGYSDFPMMIKINVVEPENADKFIRFTKIRDDREVVKEFESLPHEKIIEKIVQHLYDEQYKSKPAGYESIVRKETYDVEVKDKDGNVIAILRSSLIREIVGRDYLGQVWNVNLIGFKEDVLFGLMEEKKGVDDNLELVLDEKMFDEDGVFAVSLETYTITKDHGTRVMIVRSRN